MGVEGRGDDSLYSYSLLSTRCFSPHPLKNTYPLSEGTGADLPHEQSSPETAI